MDARGLKCPLPVLKMEKALAGLAEGGRLVVLATDPMAQVDIPLYCHQNGHAVTAARDAGVSEFVIVKGGGGGSSGSTPAPVA